MATLCFVCPRVSALDEPSPQLRVGFLKPGGGYRLDSVSLEPYVARVLAGEAARDSQPAALEALAITVRTFALANRGRHRADGFDLCDQTHCQVIRNATIATERAAQATSGRVLLRGRDVASVYYTASCGGRTEVPSAVWPGHDDPPYLPSRKDDACGGAPVWTAQIAEADLIRALRAAGFVGARLRDVRVVSRSGSDRVARLRLDGLQPSEISGQDLRMAVGRTLGWQHIKSTAFDLRKERDAYRFSGHGSGHGVGLCVIGSAFLAAEGKNAGDILGRYFPGLTISSRTSPSPTSTSQTTVRPQYDLWVDLPDEDAGEQATIVKQTLRAGDELARTLGVPPPSHLTLRFHPTTDDYERATGQPWFTSAAMVNAELHLLPLAVLRERGILDRTIRHELVHAMSDSVLGRRPLWVREGAAIYFAGEQPLPSQPQQRPAFTPEPRTSCPDDNELRHPVSVGALTNAYARARACFARQIQSGKSWRDVR